jgi:hypothetical protein
MDHLKWHLLDDESFVYLISEVLAANGYAVRYQGDGPDGGVDLFATQTISFAFDSQPFTWAVQCKFSKTPEKAVNDSEVKDVEGILRSSRFQSLHPKGYMLVTNRRISQNVVERMRGINDGTAFRTCAIDGRRLTSLVGANAELVFKYFTEPPEPQATRRESAENPLGDVERATEGVMNAYRSNKIYVPDLLLMTRLFARANREVEVALLRAQLIPEDGKGDADIEYSFKMRSRMARQRLQQMGVPISEHKEE